MTGLYELPASWPLIEQRFTVASSVYHPENENICTFDAIDYNVLAYYKAPRAGAEIFITGAADIRKGGDKREPAGD